MNTKYILFEGTGLNEKLPISIALNSPSFQAKKIGYLSGRRTATLSLPRMPKFDFGLEKSLLVTDRPKLTGLLLQKYKVPFGEIVGFEDLVHYVDGAGADGSLKASAARHHLYCPEVQDLDGKLKLLQRLTEFYLPQVPQAEITLISHTHRLYLEPRIIVDSALIRRERDVLLQAADDLLRPFSLNGVMASEGKVSPLADPRPRLAPLRGTLARMDYLRSASRRQGNALPVYLNYCSTVSGRFSGGDGFNIQGLPRSRDTQEPMFQHAYRAIRAALKAPADHCLIAADANAMEPRIVAWLCSEEWMIRCFRQGRDIYDSFADDLFPLHKVFAGKKEDFRQAAKVILLSLQYGAGACRLWENLRTWLGAETLQGIFGEENMQRRFCAQVVNQSVWTENMENFRRRLWSTFQQALTTKTESKVGPLTVASSAKQTNGVTVILPSGRRLIYRDLQTSEPRQLKQPGIEPDGSIVARSFAAQGLSYSWGTERRDLYPAKLFENVVQAIGRDLLAAAILAAEANDVHVACHVHDELIAVVPQAERERAERVLRESFAPPAWASDLTMQTKAVVGSNFNEI